MFRKLITLIIFLFSISNAFSSHLIGYDMNLVALGNNMYIVRLKCYRDIYYPLSQTMPPNISAAIYRNGNNNIEQYVTLNNIQQSNVTYNPKDCPPYGANFSLELNLYESLPINLSALNSTNGYYISTGYCCREPGRNIYTGSSSGVVFTMDFPRLNTTSPYINNSSPEFKKLPLTIFCVGKNYTLDLGAVDPNGDSLVYSIDRIISNTTKPFILYDWATGYGINNVIDGSPDLVINPTTGVFNFTPTLASTYTLAFKCEEYRNNIKIGEIRREVNFRTIVCAAEMPPITKVNDSTINSFIDTINIGETYKINFKSFDHLTDSLQMSLLPNISIGENIFNTNTFKAVWGEIGKTDSAIKVLQGVGNVESEFKWTPNCEHVREEPYTFTIITKDKTCPKPLYDSTFVKLYVTKQSNNEPYFILPDTIKRYSLKNYFIKEGDTFQLNGDSILKAYDYDSSQVISISYLPDSNNGSVNSLFEFNSFPDSIYTTASFVWDSTCYTSRAEPYNVKFFVVDNDCLKPDTATFEINIYVLEGVNAYQIQGNTQITDTSLVYTYTTLNQTGVSYNWFGQNVKIISGQGTNSVNVKFNKLDAELSCEVTDNVVACKDTSSLIIGNFVGVDNTSKTEYKIYPNPTEGIINIEALIKTKSSIVKIYSVQGKLILTKEFKDNGIIDINDFSKGVYLIKIDESVFKIVKH